MTDPGLLAGKLFNPLNNICGQNAAQGDFGALWGCFGTGLVINLVLCIIAFVLAEPLLKGFFGGYFEAVKVSRPHQDSLLILLRLMKFYATVDNERSTITKSPSNEPGNMGKSTQTKNEPK